MKNKEFKKGVAIGVAATLVVTGAGFVSYQKVLFPKGNALSDVKTVQKLNYLEELIDTEYLDEKDESSLREGLYAGLLAGLKDPYSTYYTAEQYKELNTSNEGSYVGIGAVLQKEDGGGAKVVQLYEGGPGEQAGLKTGDVIKAVDGTDVTEKETSDIASMVRDSDKDFVTLTIQREDEEKTQNLKVEIRDVEIQTVSHEMLVGDTGYIRISDRIKPHSAAAIAQLKREGIRRTVMLTGDRQAAAEPIAAQLGVDEIHSELLPADKVSIVEKLLGEGRKVAFIGDGINDAPVLARADVGIAMGAMGSDAAIEAADVVLMDDDPLKTAVAIRAARKCIRIVYENIVFALGVKAICLILGAIGVANMGAAIFADVGVMIIAVLNAIRALRVPQKL